MHEPALADCAQPYMIADPSTLFLVIAVTAVMLAGALSVVAWGHWRDGLGLWSLALVMYAGAFLLIVSRNLPQPPLSDAIVFRAANYGFTACAATMLWAVHQFQGRRPPVWSGMGLPAFGFVLYTFSADWLPGRVGIGGLLVALQTAMVVVALADRRFRTPGRGVWLVMIGMGITVPLFVFRVIAIFALDLPVADYRRPNITQTLSFLIPFMTVMLTSIGFLYMSKERADEANARLAIEDPLTGALNRRAFMAALEHEVQRATRSQQPVGLLLIDVDHFKRVNDQHGHLVGDAVLRHVVLVLRERLRAQDVLARYGGEEFVVLAPDTQADGVQHLANKLRLAIQDTAPALPQLAQPLQVTVSIGALTRQVQSETRPDELLQAADQALYQAKAQGRNRVVMAPTRPAGAEAAAIA